MSGTALAGLARRHKALSVLGGLSEPNPAGFCWVLHGRADQRRISGCSIPECAQSMI